MKDTGRRGGESGDHRRTPWVAKELKSSIHFGTILRVSISGGKNKVFGGTPSQRRRKHSRAYSRRKDTRIETIVVGQQTKQKSGKSEKRGAVPQRRGVSRSRGVQGGGRGRTRIARQTVQNRLAVSRGSRVGKKKSRTRQRNGHAILAR